MRALQEGCGAVGYRVLPLRACICTASLLVWQRLRRAPVAAQHLQCAWKAFAGVHWPRHMLSLSCVRAVFEGLERGSRLAAGGGHATVVAAAPARQRLCGAPGAAEGLARRLRLIRAAPQPRILHSPCPGARTASLMPDVCRGPGSQG